MRAQHGQASTEYIALVALVALALGAALVVRPGVGDELPSDILGAICAGVGAKCAGGHGELALAPCPTRSRTTDETVGATIASITLGRGDRAVLEQRSDGTATVSFLDGTSAGATGGVGAGFSVERGGGTLRAEGSVRGAFNTGRSYEFDNREDAFAFLERFGAEESLGGEARRLLAAGCPLCRNLGLRGRTLPEPDVSYLEGAAELDGSLAARADAATARGAAAAVTAEGRRIDHRTGERTDYYRLGGRIEGVLGEPAAGGAAGIEGEGFLEYTTAADGTPLWLRLRSVTTSAGALRGISSQSVVAGREPRRGIPNLEEQVISLDLSDPRNRQPAVALVQALGSRWELGRVAGLVAEVGERVRADARVDVRGYARRSRRSSVSGDVALGLKLGVQVAEGREVRRLTSAYTRPSGATTYFGRGDCLS